MSDQDTRTRQTNDARSGCARGSAGTANGQLRSTIPSTAIDFTAAQTFAWTRYPIAVTANNKQKDESKETEEPKKPESNHREEMQPNFLIHKKDAQNCDK